MGVEAGTRRASAGFVPRFTGPYASVGSDDLYIKRLSCFWPQSQKFHDYSGGLPAKSANRGGTGLLPGLFRPIDLTQQDFRLD